MERVYIYNCNVCCDEFESDYEEQYCTGCNSHQITFIKKEIRFVQAKVPPKE